MQFNDYFTHYQLARIYHRQDRALQQMDPRQFFLSYCTQLEKIAMAQFKKPLAQVDCFTPNLLQMETDWHEGQRPYYNLWPSIIPALTNLRLDADASLFRAPLDQLLLRFPIEGNPLTWTDKGREHSVRAVLCGNVKLYSGEQGIRWSRDEPEPSEWKRGIAFWIDCHEPIENGSGQLCESGRLHRMMYKHVVCEEGKSIEWSFDNIPRHDSADVGTHYPDSVVRDVARIVCTVCLMADDKDIVEPIVLKSDEDSWDKTGDMRLVEKAIRRGNYGFNVGRSIEVSPHVRSSSPAALYWTGQGRKIPKIRFRRGTVVHRKRLASVPTGFLDLEKGDR